MLVFTLRFMHLGSSPIMVHESLPIFSLGALVILFKSLIDIGFILVYSILYLNFLPDNHLAKQNG